MLPAAEEAHEVLARDRLDLRAQALDGPAMDARQERTITPFRGWRTGRERAAHHDALRHQPREGDLDVRGLESHRPRERVGGDGTEAFQAAAHDLDQRIVARPCLRRELLRRCHRRRVLGERIHALELRQPLGRDPNVDSRRRLFRARACGMRGRGNMRVQARGPARVDQRFREGRPALGRSHLGVGDEAETEQRIVQLVGVARFRPGLLAHKLDGRGVETTQVGGGRVVEPAPIDHRLRAALLQGRVVEIGIGPRRQDFERQRRGLGQIARDYREIAALDPPQQCLQSIDVHRLVQALVDRLLHQRMVGDLACSPTRFSAQAI